MLVHLHAVEEELGGLHRLRAIGLDSGDYSFAYVPRWSGGSVALVKSVVERVIGCARAILTSIRGEPLGRHELMR